MSAHPDQTSPMTVGPELFFEEPARTFTVQIAETKNFEIPVVATSEKQAREIALETWLSADTTGQWEIADMTTEIVAVTEARSTPPSNHSTTGEEDERRSEPQRATRGRQS